MGAQYADLSHTCFTLVIRDNKITGRCIGLEKVLIKKLSLIIV